jgi:hypothetical protein
MNNHSRPDSIRPNPREKHPFLRTAGVILVVTGLAKIVSVFGTARLLDLPDPILNVTFRHLLLAVGVAEIVIGMASLFLINQGATLLAMAWLTSAFLVYRWGLWFSGWHSPCHCLGNLTDLLHLSPQIADTITIILLCYLLLGSYGSLYRLRAANLN